MLQEVLKYGKCLVIILLFLNKSFTKYKNKKKPKSKSTFGFLFVFKVIEFYLLKRPDVFPPKIPNTSFTVEKLTSPS